MIEIKDVIEKIKNLPNSGVDINYKQGMLAFLKQNDYLIDEEDAQKWIEDLEAYLAALKKRAQPQKIPEEYIFFLEFYGGLYIDGDSHYFTTHGWGPKSEEWYSPIDSPIATPETVEHGFLHVGKLIIHEGEHKGKNIKFFLDLAGKVQKYCILSVGPMGREDIQIPAIIKDIHKYPGTWNKVADSFVLWLEKAAETNGSFGYTEWTKG